MKIKDPIKVGLHGHGLPDYSDKWKKRLGVEGRNTAEVIFERCIKENIGIYTLTNEPEFPGHMIKSRYDHVSGFAQDLSKQKNYEYGSLGDNAFILRKGENGTEHTAIFQRGESLRIKDKSLETGNPREYELLTFGRDKIVFGKSKLSYLPLFEEAFGYLNGEGLPAMGEHLLAEGHHGPYEVERIKEFCENGNFLAVEHNAKVAMPKWCSFLIPPIGPLKKIRGGTKSTNYQLAKLVKPFETPIIGNDDADFPSHIGAAYTEFPKDKIRMDSDETIKDDLITLIRNNDFNAHRGHISTFEVFKYAYLIKTT